MRCLDGITDSMDVRALSIGVSLSKFILFSDFWICIDSIDLTVEISAFTVLALFLLSKSIVPSANAVDNTATTAIMLITIFLVFIIINTLLPRLFDASECIIRYLLQFVNKILQFCYILFLFVKKLLLYLFSKLILLKVLLSILYSLCIRD